MTDFRALCAELVEKWDNAAELDDLCDVADVMGRARAALAQPEPQEPTDEELFELSLKTRLIGSIAVAAACHPDKVDPRDACAPAHTATLDFARAVLARWGRPAIEPVPVSERLPGPEDCDAEGGCWWWIVDQPGELPHWIYCQLEVLSWTNFTAWLPHHALPVPQP